MSSVSQVVAPEMAEMTDDEFRQHVLSILQRELGDAGVARFLGVNPIGTGDFTRDRRKWQKGLTVRKIADRIAKRKSDSA